MTVQRGSHSNRELLTGAEQCVCVCVCLLVSDLFVGGGVGQADPLDLGPGVPIRTGTAAETWGSVYAAHAHVARHHRTLQITETETHIKLRFINEFSNYS